jgi:hypothetical protein
MANKAGVTVTQDRMAQFQKGLKILAGMDVLVGVPEDKAARRPAEDDEDAPPINNAALAYIHDRGAPEVNLPARPFMAPGIKAAQPRIAASFRLAAERALAGASPSSLVANLTAAGLAAQSAIRAVINAGPPPPLSPNYLRARDRKKLAQLRRQKGMTPELYRAAREALLADRKPLVDTGQLRNSINFVIRDK